MIHVDTFMRRGKQDEKKAEQERLQGILLDMLKEDENKYCADCQAKTPRWAAWNLGVFICIRCAGIHRNLGVHISKVRSVNLDSWTPEQVQSMRVMGNEKARKVYEHSLPDHFRRSMSDHQMEQFIRAKYEQKRYMLPNFVYPRVDANDLPKSGQPLTKQKTSTTAASLTSPSNARVSAAPTVSPTTNSQGVIVSDLLDFTSPASPSNQANGDSSLAGDLPSLSLANDQKVSTNNKSDLDDMFGSFASAPVIESGVVAGVSGQGSPSDSAKEPSSNLQTGADLMSLSNAATTNGEKKSNADILSLFGDLSKGPIHPIMSVGGFAAFGLQAAPSQPQQAVAASDPFGAPSDASQTMGTVPIGAPGMNTTPMVAPAVGVAPMRMPPISVPFGAPVMGAGVMAAPFGGAFPLQTSGFPNPFEQQEGVMRPQGFSTGTIPTSTTSMVNAPVMQKQQPSTTPGFSSRANNAFADLSIGKVLNMNYMSAKSSMPSAPAKSQQAATPSDVNFDDLLGL